MSIPFSGRIRRSGGLTAAIFREVKQINLKPVKKVTFKFDPFVKESEATRNFMFNFTTRGVLTTNLNCKVKAEVLCDRSGPSVLFDLVNGSSVLMKSQNLSTLELCQLYNKHITSLVPKDESTAVVKTKSEKKAGRRY